jgi:hypothetical protein
MPKQYLRKARVAARYDASIRWVERAVEDGRLPAPVYRGRIPIWDESKLDEADRAALRARPTEKAA